MFAKFFKLLMIIFASIAQMFVAISIEEASFLDYIIRPAWGYKLADLRTAVEFHDLEAFETSYGRLCKRSIIFPHSFYSRYLASRISPSV